MRELNFSLSGLVGFDIQGKTIGIIGTGKIGQITAQIFRGFDANVVAYDPYPASEWAASHQVRYTDMSSLLAQSDVISLHLPLSPGNTLLAERTNDFTDETRCFYINTSRGKLVDTTALIAALKTGHIGGVALDVYEEEEGIFFQDLSGQVLLDDVLTHLLMFPNVLVTSHQAFLTHEALHEIARVTTENICKLEAGEPFLEGTNTMSQLRALRGCVAA